MLDLTKDRKVTLATAANAALGQVRPWIRKTDSRQIVNSLLSEIESQTVNEQDTRLFRLGYFKVSFTSARFRTLWNIVLPADYLSLRQFPSIFKKLQKKFPAEVPEQLAIQVKQLSTCSLDTLKSLLEKMLEDCHLFLLQEASDGPLVALFRAPKFPRFLNEPRPDRFTKALEILSKFRGVLRTWGSDLEMTEARMARVWQMARGIRLGDVPVWKRPDSFESLIPLFERLAQIGTSTVPSVFVERLDKLAEYLDPHAKGVAKDFEPILLMLHLRPCAAVKLFFERLARGFYTTDPVTVARIVRGNKENWKLVPPAILHRVCMCLPLRAALSVTLNVDSFLNDLYVTSDPQRIRIVLKGLGYVVKDVEYALDEPLFQKLLSLLNDGYNLQWRRRGEMMTGSGAPLWRDVAGKDPTTDYCRYHHGMYRPCTAHCPRSAYGTALQNDAGSV
jgi:hypothetical protein